MEYLGQYAGKIVGYLGKYGEEVDLDGISGCEITALTLLAD